MKPLLSVIVPCFNEAEVLWETHGRLSDELSRLDDLDFEIIYVDDGSRDTTPDMLREIQAIDPHTRVIRFSRNFGHQTAVTAGLEHASRTLAIRNIVVRCARRWIDRRILEWPTSWLAPSER